jgi:glycosidase
MALVARTEDCDWFETEITLSGKRFKYYFKLDDGKEEVFFCADGFLEKPEETNAFFYPYINRCDVLNLPEWARGEIIYQVWIDRFFDGNPENNPHGVKPFGALPDTNTYYGGDFEGLTVKLDYLAEMGVKTLYLSPLFEAKSYHKYDVIDYTRVESIYGGEEGLAALVKAAHAKGLKIVLDAVFNHCSDRHPFFQDVLKNQNLSKYAEWFTIRRFPVEDAVRDYDSFGGMVPSMPRFNTDHPQVIDYLVGIAEHWTRQLDIDGWRLDVADEVSHSFWKIFRQRLRNIKKDVLIIGEVWNQAGCWLLGDEMDTVTNYAFMKWLRAFARAEIDAVRFWQRMYANTMLYKTPVHSFLVNLVGSHDTMRNRRYTGSEKIHELMLSVLLCFQGIPLIYYGDEVAMDGDEDPDNRRAMRWGQNESLRNRIATLGQIRCHSDVLKKGKMVPLDVSPRVLAFWRIYDGKRLFIIANFDSLPTNPIPLRTENSLLFGRARVDGREVIVPEHSFALFEENA